MSDGVGSDRDKMLIEGKFDENRIQIRLVIGKDDDLLAFLDFVFAFDFVTEGEMKYWPDQDLP